MGVNNTTTLTREAKVPRGGLSASDLFRLKLTKISATAVITGMVALASLGIPGNASASDNYFDRQVGSAVEDISRRTINKASDSIFNVIGGIITGKTLENAKKQQQQPQAQPQLQATVRMTAQEGRMEDLRNELQSRGFPRDKVQVSTDDFGRIVMRGVLGDANAKKAVMEIAKKYGRTNNDVVDKVFVMAFTSTQDQMSNSRQGL